MMSSQTRRRGSQMSRTVRHSTSMAFSDFDAPLGTSLTMKSENKLNDVNTAEAMKRLRQALGELTSACRNPGRATLKPSRMDGR